MDGRSQRPTIGHRVFPPSILFLIRSQIGYERKPARSLPTLKSGSLLLAGQLLCRDGTGGAILVGVLHLGPNLARLILVAGRCVEVGQVKLSYAGETVSDGFAIRAL